MSMFKPEAKKRFKYELFVDAEICSCHQQTPINFILILDGVSSHYFINDCSDY